jgi:oxygen-dependent protoporphyrinogen oxidase
VTESELPIVIVGAGITGLSAAYRLFERGLRVIVCEASSKVGGNIETARHDGYVYDLGPDSFLKAKPAGLKLCKDLGLEAEIISPLPGAQLVHVARAGKLYPMPEGLSLGVPKRPGPILGTPLLSLSAKMRALLEPFVPPAKEVGEETIQEFLERRLGAPLLSGVFAGDATRLSMNAAFPQLVELEKKHGSLFSGMNGGKSVLSVLFEKDPPPASPFMSLRGGLSDLVEALVRRLPPEMIRLQCPVRAVVPPRAPGDFVEVELDGEKLRAAHVIVAGPPWSARSLLGELDREFEEALGAVNGFSTATVFFGLSQGASKTELSGSGFIDVYFVQMGRPRSRRCGPRARFHRRLAQGHPNPAR